jgi:hypothetical protein
MTTDIRAAFFAQADAARIPMPDASVDLVFTSPPYMAARTYGIDAQRDCAEWIDWMLAVVSECTRVCRGLVVVNCAGQTMGRCYQPGPEGLLYEWWRRGGQCWRPCYYHRVGVPGSGNAGPDGKGGRRQWFRSDIEHVSGFKRTREWCDSVDSRAIGHAPKFSPGGAMSNRKSNGERVNCDGRDEFGGTTGSGGSRRAKGQTKKRVRDGQHANEQPYREPAIANVGNLMRECQHDGEETIMAGGPDDGWGFIVHTNAGGGHMGSDLAHENEAPFPEALAEPFVLSCSRPGDLVLDPFSGSGTTVAVAHRLGRRGIGFDLRMSQCDLGRRRLAETQPEMFA